MSSHEADQVNSEERQDNEDDLREAAGMWSTRTGIIDRSFLRAQQQNAARADQDQGNTDSDAAYLADQGISEAVINDLVRQIGNQVYLDITLLDHATEEYVESPQANEERWSPILEATPDEIKGRVDALKDALAAGNLFATELHTNSAGLVREMGVFTNADQDAGAKYLLTSMTVMRTFEDRFAVAELPQFSAGAELVGELWPGKRLDNPEVGTFSLNQVIEAALQSRPATPIPQP